MNEEKWNELHDIFKTWFNVGLKKYPDKDYEINYALIIDGKEYPGYEGYVIHAGTNDIKLVQNPQRKATTMTEKEKLHNLRVDVEILNVMIR